MHLPYQTNQVHLKFYYFFCDFFLRRIKLDWISIICFCKKWINIISCGTTPILPLTVFGSKSKSTPQTLTLPDVLLVKPDKILINVLSAPFGPKRPKIEPYGISRSI